MNNDNKHQYDSPPNANTTSNNNNTNQLASPQSLGLIALAAAVGTSIPMLINYFLTNNTNSNNATTSTQQQTMSKCPFSGQQVAQQQQQQQSAEDLYPHTSTTGCPYLASKDLPTPPIDIARFPLSTPQQMATNALNATKSPTPQQQQQQQQQNQQQQHNQQLYRTKSDQLEGKPIKTKEPVQYHKYLYLDEILNAQKPLSWGPEEDKTNAHDEHLFIITHQASELWFKQMIHDLLSIIDVFNQPYVSESHMTTVIERLKRIARVQVLLIDHIKLLHRNMSPLSFLSFRDFLSPASGFQSVQMRQIECLLGLERSARVSYAGSDYDTVLLPEQQEMMKKLETTIPSLFVLIDRWLQRLPLLNTSFQQEDGGEEEHNQQQQQPLPTLAESPHAADLMAPAESGVIAEPTVLSHTQSQPRTVSYSFWADYEKGVNKSLDQQLRYIEHLYQESEQREAVGDDSKPRYTKQRRDAEMAKIFKQKEHYQNFFDQELYEKNILQARPTTTTTNTDNTTNTSLTSHVNDVANHQHSHNIFSYKAMQAILMINFYQEVPLFQGPYQLIDYLQQIDENFQQWRAAHAQMVYKMLGTKMGTGGSSGHQYLTQTVYKHRVFHQLASLSSLMVPRDFVPPLPPEVFKKANFFQHDTIKDTMTYAHSSNYLVQEHQQQQQQQQQQLQQQNDVNTTKDVADGANNSSGIFYDISNIQHPLPQLE